MVREDTKEFQILKELLDNERVNIEVVERRLGGAKLFGTAHAYALERRIIIIRRYVLGFRKSIKILKYSDITEVNMERGLIYCKVHFALQGEHPESEESRKWLLGLTYDEGLELVRFVSKMGVRPVIKS